MPQRVELLGQIAQPLLQPLLQLRTLGRRRRGRRTRRTRRGARRQALQLAQLAELLLEARQLPGHHPPTALLGLRLGEALHLLLDGRELVGDHRLLLRARRHRSRLGRRHRTAQAGLEGLETAGCGLLLRLVQTLREVHVLLLDAREAIGADVGRSRLHHQLRRRRRGGRRTLLRPQIAHLVGEGLQLAAGGIVVLRSLRSELLLDELQLVLAPLLCVAQPPLEGGDRGRRAAPHATLVRRRADAGLVTWRRHLLDLDLALVGTHVEDSAPQQARELRQVGLLDRAHKVACPIRIFVRVRERYLEDDGARPLVDHDELGGRHPP